MEIVIVVKWNVIFIAILGVYGMPYGKGGIGW
jgi:hypothetical protein